jgi:acyl dehydratase
VPTNTDARERKSLSAFAEQLLATEGTDTKILVGGKVLTFGNVFAFLNAVGDSNPVHVDVSAAKNLLDGKHIEGAVIVPGAMILGCVLGLLDEKVRGNDETAPAAVLVMNRVKWSRPIQLVPYARREICVHARCTHAKREHEGITAHISFEVGIPYDLGYLPEMVTGVLLATFVP